MSIEQELQTRSESKCELCSATENLEVYEVPASPDNGTDSCVLICATCRQQIETPEKIDANHWRCLNDSMWSQVPAVQVMAWRILTRLSTDERTGGWPQDLLDMLYLDDAILNWANASGEGQPDEDALKHLDSNGAVLAAGDTVTRGPSKWSADRYLDQVC